MHVQRVLNPMIGITDYYVRIVRNLWISNGSDDGVPTKGCEDFRFFLLFCATSCVNCETTARA